MGCVKSKRGASAQEKGNSADRGSGWSGGEEASLVDPQNAARSTAPPLAADAPPSALLAYAQRLSEEIVCRAVQQWADVDRRYGDIPFIECDTP